MTERATFRAVYRVPHNRSSMELFRRDGFGGRNPIPVRSVRYRFANGTVINGSQFGAYGGEIRQTTNVVEVRFPNHTPPGPDGETGTTAARSSGNASTNVTTQFAFTSDSTPKRFSLPTFAEGSYELVLPPDRRVDFVLFGAVVPAADDRWVDDTDRTHFRWEEVTTQSLVVQFYLERDLRIFGGLAALAVLVGAVGVAYYIRQIRALRERREEFGLDVDTDEDEFKKGPPPGMG